MLPSDAARLEEHGIRPTAQRLAIARFVLHTEAHPSADEVWDEVRVSFPMVSRATVYNTLNLFVGHGLLRPLVVTEGRVVFDPNVERHHHFIDEETGEIVDLPWNSLVVGRIDALQGFDVHDYQVVVRGTRRRRRART
ncbi:MAG: transcriptional repressor [Deltaproteobacteria bacterium]|jgi:Fe2+ or Zn2+ uptake regulation protein|nr:transcriptional repressor [Deltaproteobacteria bacterium]